MRPPRKILEQYYITEHKSLQEIGNICGVSKQCVFQWVDYYGLPRRRTRRNTSKISKAQLKDYIDSGYSIHKIAIITKMTDMMLWGLLYDYDLYDYYMNIPFSERWTKDLTEEELQRIYNSCKVEDVMKKLNCKNKEKFYEILTKYNIKRKYNTHK